MECSLIVKACVYCGWINTALPIRRLNTSIKRHKTRLKSYEFRLGLTKLFHTTYEVGRGILICAKLKKSWLSAKEICEHNTIGRAKV